MEYNIKTLDEVTERINNFAKVGVMFGKGEIVGYQISCPHCHCCYTVSYNEFNYDLDITCQSCGSSYKQNENIVGAALRKEVGAYEG